MPSEVERFAEAAEAFCYWAETAPRDPKTEPMAAIEHLSRLYRAALLLPELFDEQDSPDISQEDWARVYARFGTMPFNSYAQCYDPQELNAVAGVCDLADDLADVWRDLKSGLLLFRAGNPASACWEWKEAFWRHWGQHATGALNALHRWQSQYG